MQRALSTHLFVQQRLNTVMLDQIWDAGIPLVEIFCAKQHIDYNNKAQISELGYWFRNSPLQLHALHSPMYRDDVWGRTGPDSVITITEPVKAKRIQMVDEIKRALEIAETIPCRFLIQHIGVRGEEFSERAVDSAFTALEEIILFARHRGVNVLVENIPNELSSAERLLTFLELTHLDVGFCFDSGHANMHEGVGNAYQLMKDRIRSTHLHDNNGVDDSHLFPLEQATGTPGGTALEGAAGTIDWTATMQLLRSREDQYPLLLELREAPDMHRPLDVVRQVFDRLENLRAPEHES
jgi:sugar phosphate isomerase/epimerase